MFFYTQEGRTLRHLITALLKSGAAKEIKRMNYVSSYTLLDGKIVKKAEKAVVVTFEEGQKAKLEGLLKKSDITYKFI